MGDCVGSAHSFEAAAVYQCFLEVRAVVKRAGTVNGTEAVVLCKKTFDLRAMQSRAALLPRSLAGVPKATTV